MPGSPSTIHSASCQPEPPAAVMPKLWPSLSQRFRTPHAGPISGTAVRRVRDGAVHDVLDAAGGERGHAALRRFDVRQQALEIAFEQTLAEPIGHAVRESRRSAGLVGAQDPAHALFAQVIRLVGFAQHRELAPAALAVRLEVRRLVVNDVLVLDRDGGNVDAEQPPRLTCVVAGGADHMLGNDVAFVGGELPLARRACVSRAVTSVCS